MKKIISLALALMGMVSFAQAGSHGGKPATSHTNSRTYTNPGNTTPEAGSASVEGDAETNLILEQLAEKLEQFNADNHCPDSGCAAPEKVGEVATEDSAVTTF